MEDDLHKLPGPLLILAGPGTGKTTRLAQRMKYLVEEQNILPENITVITFTGAAAKNMRERISDSNKKETFVPHEKQPKIISTMHSLGYRIIREKAPEIGFDENIRVAFLDKTRDILVGDAAQISGFCRADGKETAKCRQFGVCIVALNETKCKICKTYKEILRSCSAVDYDDMILLACELLRGDKALLDKYRSYCKQLLIDEYQDINSAQFDLIQLLSLGQLEGLFVVGDDDQSIYSWRGGSPGFIRKFKTHFGDRAKIKPLCKSYRCHRHILEGAFGVVAKFDRDRLPKDEFEYEHEEGKLIQVHNTPSDVKEAIIVRGIVERALPSRSVLILYPKRQFLQSIVNELKKARIPYSAPLPLPGEGLPLISELYEWLMDTSNSMAFRECLEAFIDAPDSGIPSERSKRPEKLAAREAALLKVSKLWIQVISGKSDGYWAALDQQKNGDDFYSKAYSTFNNIFSLNSAGDAPTFMAEVIDKLAPWKNTKGMLEEIDSWVEISRRTECVKHFRTLRVCN